MFRSASRRLKCRLIRVTIEIIGERVRPRPIKLRDAARSKIWIPAIGDDVLLRRFRRTRTVPGLVPTVISDYRLRQPSMLGTADQLSSTGISHVRPILRKVPCRQIPRYVAYSICPRLPTLPAAATGSLDAVTICVPRRRAHGAAPPRRRCGTRCTPSRRSGSSATSSARTCGTASATGRSALRRSGLNRFIKRGVRLRAIVECSDVLTTPCNVNQ